MFENALCQGRPTEWWYPVREGKTSEELSQISVNMKRAMKICQTCPACTDCLQYSIDHNEVGIWGGMGEKTRKKARRMLRLGSSIDEVIAKLVVGKKR